MKQFHKKQSDHEYKARAAERLAAFVRGSIDLDGSLVEITILNLSRRGFMAEAAAPVPLDAVAQLRFGEQGPFAAHVKWARGQQFGCEFGDDLAWIAFAEALLRSREPVGPRAVPD